MYMYRYPLLATPYRVFPIGNATTIFVEHLLAKAASMLVLSFIGEFSRKYAKSNFPMIV